MIGEIVIAGVVGIFIGYTYNDFITTENEAKKKDAEYLESRLKWLEMGTQSMNGRLNDLESKRPTYIYALDPSIKRRVVHVIKDGYAVSMVTGHKFPFGSEDYDGMMKRFKK